MQERQKLRKKKEAFIRVKMKSGKQYEGWPKFIPSGNNTSEIFLALACELASKNGKQQTKPLPGAGVLLYEREIESIIFVDTERSDCYDCWYGSGRCVSRLKQNHAKQLLTK